MQQSRPGGQSLTPERTTSICSVGQICTMRQDETRTDALEKGPHAEWRRKRKRRLDTFPTRLHTLLDNNVDAHRFAQNLISWRPHGRCFYVHNTTDFEQEVMPVVFKQTKWSSFQRQLNLYGFQRLSHGKDKGCYWNKFFLRGKPELCDMVIRTKVKGTKVRAACDPTSEPNFCTMVAMPPAPRISSNVHLHESPLKLSANHSLRRVKSANSSAQSKTFQRTSQYEGFVAQQRSTVCSSRPFSALYSNQHSTTHSALDGVMTLNRQPNARDCFTSPAVFIPGAPTNSSNTLSEGDLAPLDHQGLWHNPLLDIEFLSTQWSDDDSDNDSVFPTFPSQYCNTSVGLSAISPTRTTASVPIMSCHQRNQQLSLLSSNDATHSKSSCPQYQFFQNGLMRQSSVDIFPQQNDAWGDLFEIIHKR